MKHQKTIGVYWGRFNPPHKGHLKMIRRLSGRVDKLIVAIGGAEHKNTKRNPFTGNERKKMMEAYIKELGIKGTKTVLVKDGSSYSYSINHIMKKYKPDVFFVDKRVIANSIGKKIKIVSFKRKGKISATRIRDAIANGKKWEHLTGKSVAKLIRKFNGIKRIKKIYGKDN